jgi:hypothetical protein
LNRKQSIPPVSRKKLCKMSWWPFGSGTAQPERKTKPDAPMVAANDPVLRSHFSNLLDYTEPPAVFAASEVAHALSDDELGTLGFTSWRDALPAIKALAWETRAFGDCEIYYPNGKKVPQSVSWMEVGPIRIRRKATVYSADDWD